MQEWIGVRELGRRVGRKHRAVQRAIEEGRIPAAAVRRDPATGRVVAIEYCAAALAWEARTDPDQAARRAPPLRLPAGVQTSALPAEPAGAALGLGLVGRGASLREPDAAEAVRYGAALEMALLVLPAELGEQGLAGEAIDRLLEQLYGAIADELRARGAHETYIAEELGMLRDRVADERAKPGIWTG